MFEKIDEAVRLRQKIKEKTLNKLLAEHIYEEKSNERKKE